MTLKELMAADAAIFFDTTNGTAVDMLYNGASIPVLIDIGQTQTPGNTYANGRGSEGTVDQSTISILHSDVASPEAGDIIASSDGLKSWQVVRIVSDDGAVYQLECVTNSSPWRR